MADRTTAPVNHRDRCTAHPYRHCCHPACHACRPWRPTWALATDTPPLRCSPAVSAGSSQNARHAYQASNTRYSPLPTHQLAAVCLALFAPAAPEPETHRCARRLAPRRFGHAGTSFPAKRRRHSDSPRSQPRQEGACLSRLACLTYSKLERGRSVKRQALGDVVHSRWYTPTAESANHGGHLSRNIQLARREPPWKWLGRDGLRNGRLLGI